MMSIARRNMKTARGRLAFSIGGVAVATLLLSFVLALYQGFSSRIASYVEDVPADVWVVGAGNESFFNPSIIPNSRLPDLQAVKGIESFDTLLIWSMKIRTAKGSWDSYVIGFNPDGLGGPIAVKAGSRVPETGQIIVDDVLARQAGIKLGDEVIAGLRRLKVVGISTGGNLVVNQISFVTKEEASILIGIPGFVNYGLIKAEPGQAGAVVERVNNDVIGLKAYSSADYADSSKQLLRRSLLPVLLVILILSTIVGTVVVGLTIYSSVTEKEREFGVLKALGAPGPSLLRIVAEQSLVCGIAGFLIGEGLALAASRLAVQLVPQFVTLFRTVDIAAVFTLALVMSLVAAIIPILRITRVDPLTVFKA
jgi:putative ABC transport system permease protein